MKKETFTCEQVNAIIELDQIEILVEMIHADIVTAGGGAGSRLEPAFCLLQDTVSRKLSELYRAFGMDAGASARCRPLDCPPDSP